MRTLTAAQQAVFDSGVQSEHCRVFVKDGGGTWRDLTIYPGFNAVKAVRWSERIDDPHMTLSVTLKREAHRLSLSPFMTGSALNKGFDPAGAYSPLLKQNREIYVEVAIVAMDKQPASGDWFEVFRGKVDRVDAARGRDVELSARGKSGRLAQQYIKTEYVYSYAADGGSAKPLRIWEPQIPVTTTPLVYGLPASRGTGEPGENKFVKCSQAGTTGTTEPVWTTAANQTDGSAKWDYVGAPTSSGNPVEQVMQNILDDNKQGGDPTVTLYTPASPGWDITQYIQQREFTLDAIRALAGQIGWDIRYKWRSGTGQFELTFYEPPRTAPTVAFTFGRFDFHDPERVAVDIMEIRNSWRVIYMDKGDLWPDGTPKRKEVNVSDPTSIADNDELWAEIQEDETGNIDSVTEATTLANAALSDCKDPTVELSVPLVRGFPWTELNDYYTFSADGVRFDTDLSLAVTEWDQTFQVSDEGKARLSTKLGCRGLPTAGARVHLSKTVGPHMVPREHPHQRVQFQGTKTPTFIITPTVGGARVQVDQTFDKRHLPEELEIHISPTPGFTPSNLTLKGLTKSQTIELSDLVPAAEQFIRTVPRYRNAEKLIRGQPSAEQSFFAGQGSAGHLKQEVEWGRMPLNGGFETWAGGHEQAPDHWEISDGGDFVTGNVIGVTGAEGVSGDSWAKYIASHGDAELRTKVPFTVAKGTAYDVAWWVQLIFDGTVGEVTLFVRWLDYNQDLISDEAVDVIGLAPSGFDPTPVDGEWHRRAGVVTAPETARFGKIVIKTTVTPDDTCWVPIDSVRFDRA